MPLEVTHKGWENEHLATFLLSRVAFVASPKTVADDLGTDIFCTLFERHFRKGVSLLVPRSSVAVQVKSSRDPVPIGDRLDYFERLEIPYYVGVVDQAALTLDLYSARYLPAVLALYGRPERLRLVPVEEFDRHYRPKDRWGHKLLCHKVVTLRAHDDAEATARAASELREDAAAGLKVIASRLNQEYVFDIIGGDVEIFMGPGSATTFRESFLKRLAEALLNLAWLIDHKSPSRDEVDAYLSMADTVAGVAPLPAYVSHARGTLLRKREEKWPK